mgnify:CR=1 FL=1
MGKESLKIKKDCFFCRKEFLVPSYRGNSAKFCSRECFFNSRIKTEKDYLNIFCSYCHEKLSKRQLIERRKYCSCKCYSKSRKGKLLPENIRLRRFGVGNPNYGNGEKLRGDKNPNWRGGLSYEHYHGEYEEIRKGLIKRYGSRSGGIVCPSCQTASLMPQLHHINYNKQDNREENLIFLCPSCHGKSNFHRDHWETNFKNIKEFIHEIQNGYCFSNSYLCRF